MHAMTSLAMISAERCEKKRRKEVIFAGFQVMNGGELKKKKEESSSPKNQAQLKYQMLPKKRLL